LGEVFPNNIKKDKFKRKFGTIYFEIDRERIEEKKGTGLLDDPKR
jgi:hypothetical protein